MEPSVMAVLAHPDDELAVAGMLAACASEGVQVVLVCATPGDLGGIADPSLATRETLADVRQEELRCSCRSLGIRYLEILPYGDSGWRPDHGEPPATSLARAETAEVIRKLARLVRRYQPQVLITFGPDGLYGHRDHITVGAYATAAFGAAGDSHYPCREGAEALDPWQPGRLFYLALPQGLRNRLMEPAAAASTIGRITHEVDVQAYLPAKLAAARCHETQRLMWEVVEDPSALEAFKPLLATECLVLAQERACNTKAVEGGGPVFRQLLAG